MTVSIRMDLAEGGGASYGSRGWTARRVAVVEGLTGTKQSRLFAAVKALWGPPYSMRLGQRHPAEPSIVLSAMTPEIFGTDVRVTIEYAAPEVVSFGGKKPNTGVPGIHIESDAVFQEEPCDTDKDGNPMIVQYTDADGKLHKHPCHATVARGHRLLRITRFSHENESEKYAYLIGLVNERGWSPNPRGQYGGIREWRLNRINSTSDDGGKNWANLYEFEHNLKKWNSHFSYVDPETGRMPEDILTKGDCDKEFEVLSEFPFANLGLGGG